jgi:hypothetical protein
MSVEFWNRFLLLATHYFAYFGQAWLEIKLSRGFALNLTLEKYPVCFILKAVDLVDFFSALVTGGFFKAWTWLDAWSCKHLVAALLQMHFDLVSQQLIDWLQHRVGLVCAVGQELLEFNDVEFPTNLESELVNQGVRRSCVSSGVTKLLV